MAEKASAWAYLTVSTARQAETLEDQQNWAFETAATNGWEVTRTFKGVSSGVAGVRKLLEELLGALESTPKAQRPRRILMIRLDRTGRGLGLDSLAALARIHSYGTMIHTRQDGDLSIAKASDVLLPVIRVLTAATENEARRDKALATYAARRAAGKHLGSLAPYGVEIVNGEPRALEPAASVVRKIFELRAAGHGYRTIVRELYLGAPPKIRKDGTVKTLSWDPSSARYTVGCTTYRGVVVDADLWDRANAVSHRGFNIKEATRYAWPLGGAIVCECGKRLTGNPSKSNWNKRRPSDEKGPKTYTYRYYACINVKAHGGKILRHRADRVEAQVPAIFARLQSTPLAEEQYAEQSQKGRAEIQTRIRNAEQHVATLQRRKTHAWDSAADGLISNEELGGRLKAIDGEIAESQLTLEQERKKLVALQTRAGAEERLQDVLADLVTLWPSATTQQQRAAANALNQIVGGLIVTADGTLKTFLDSQKDRLQT